MAFIDTVCKDRFSLLLLEPGEIYFEDFSVFCYPGPLEEESKAIQRKRKGRLKLCSKSLVFEPQEISQPLIKIPFSECEVLEKWHGPLISRITNKGGIRIVTKQVTEMLERNLLCPYNFCREKQELLFVHNYATVEDSLPRMQQLRRAATLSRGDQASMIATIVHSLQNRITFNMSWIDNLYESEVLEVRGSRITPLVVNPGRIYLTDSRLYFQPYNNAEPDTFNTQLYGSMWPVLKIKLSDISRVIPRRFLLRQVGLELFFCEKAPLPHLFLTFDSSAIREQVLESLRSLSKIQEPPPTNMTLLWQNREVSNYDYLLYLNSLADRSFNDLTQYPVFPWVLQDYTSTTLDLENPAVFRDLTKPIGALNPERLQRLKARLQDMEEVTGGPTFLYGSHYSTPGFVLFYLARKLPQYMLCLQNGRFDHPDRMFNSMATAWRNVTVNTSDFKELIPEFYDPSNKGDFLINLKKINFGLRQDGKRVGDVELPPWAKDPEDFVKKMREALESEEVSRQLPHWIDLIFGYKQRGEGAKMADNLFHPMTYEGSIDLDNIKDINERYAQEVQIMEYGQTPRQIFHHPHPQRTPPEPEPLEPSECKVEVEENKPIRRLSLHRQLAPNSLVPLAQHTLHKEKITDIAISEDCKIIFSLAMDSQLKLYSMESKSQLRSINLFQRYLTSCCLIKGEPFLLLGSSDHYIYLYNLSYGTIADSSLAHNDALTQIHWNKGLLATGSWDATAKVWKYPVPGPNQTPHFQLMAELDHDSKVSCLQLSPYNTLLATGTSEGMVYLWDMLSFQQRRQHGAHEDEVTGVAFNSDSSRLASCGKDGRLWVLDVVTGTTLFCREGLSPGLGCLCWEAEVVVVGCLDGRLLLWDLVHGQQADLEAHQGAVTCVRSSQDGTLIVTGGADNTVRAWRPQRA